MKQAPSTVEICKKTKLLAVACDVKPKVIFCGICIHELCFLTYYENGGLFTVDDACCVVSFFPWLHFLCYGYFLVGALIGLSSNGAGWK
jgi:hypothetical protein